MEGFEILILEFTSEWKTENKKNQFWNYTRSFFCN